MKNQARTSCASAPACGKIILSGEHAVVYGSPALACAVNLFTTSTLELNAKQNIVFFDFSLWNYQAECSFAELRNLRQTIDERYQNYLAHACQASDVIRHEPEFAQYAFASLFEHLHLALPCDCGISVKITSDIQAGCGMGSSAALIVSLLRATVQLFNLQITLRRGLLIGRSIENVQHGHSSGLDISIALRGESLYFCKGKARPAAPLLMDKICLINTGKPLATTGECVSSVAHHFAHDPKLKEQFALTTRKINRALKKNDWLAFKNNLRINNELLASINVVPEVVRMFIREIETRGGAAKICGAGSVRGDDHAGIVLALDAGEFIEDLAKRHGYELLRV